MQEEQVLDPAAVAELRRAQQAFGNPDFIRQLVALFRENTPGKMSRIREAVAAGNAGAIVTVAHTLKTNCAMLGAARMAEACGRTEAAAEGGELPSAAEAFEDAERELPRVLEALSLLAEQSGHAPS